MPKALKNLTTEDIRTDDLAIDAVTAAQEAEPEDEERFFPLLGIRCKVSEADRLLAEQAEQQAE